MFPDPAGEHGRYEQWKVRCDLLLLQRHSTQNPTEPSANVTLR